MTTELLPTDPANPDPAVIGRAAAVLRGGGLVAFPTETVYGLGANALDPAAVGRIFAAKGRPATNPVIVHVADPDQVRTVAADWPGVAAQLAERFWPGPLTLVVAKRPEVPDAVTAGGPMVAVRCPAHPIARALIRAASVPVAAPSANRSTELSPTRAGHVLKGLNGRIEMVVDGGPCPGGIESTVVDVTGGTVRILRPGLVTVPMLEEVIGRVELPRRDELASRERERPEIARSPGQMAKHYSPRTVLRIAGEDGLFDDMYEAIAAGKQVAGVWFDRGDAPREVGSRAGGRLIRLPADPDRAATALYDTLHQLDHAGLDLILVELPPDTPGWAAVRDRLTRAAAL